MLCHGRVSAEELKQLAARARCVFPEDCSDLFDKWASEITRDAAGRDFEVVWVAWADHKEVKKAYPSVKWLN